jgi:hypothetical protein
MASANDGPAAVEKFEAGGYDLVIAHLRKGQGMNCWDLAQKAVRSTA